MWTLEDKSVNVKDIFQILTLIECWMKNTVEEEDQGKKINLNEEVKKENWRVKRHGNRGWSFYYEDVCSTMKMFILPR